MKFYYWFQTYHRRTIIHEFMWRFEVKCWRYKDKSFNLITNADSWLLRMPISWTLPPSPCTYNMPTHAADRDCLPVDRPGLLVTKSKHDSQEHQSHQVFQQDNKGYLGNCRRAELLLSQLISMVIHPATNIVFLILKQFFNVKIFRIFKVEIIRFKESQGKKRKFRLITFWLKFFIWGN